MYVPMLEPPSYTDLNYIVRSAGGKNPCIPASGNSVLPNCCGYVVGRMLSLFGDDAYDLPWQENAGQYYPKLVESSIWKRSSKPTPGCIACWSRAGQAGHVAVVEQVNPDGSIVTSESAWQSTRFYTQTLQPPKYTWNPVYVLQGFIYNTKGPTGSGSSIESFISAAKNYVGKKASDIGLKDNKNVSAEFLIKCAKEVDNLVGTVIPNKPSPSTFTSAGTNKGMGTFLKGPLYNRVFVPKQGDIMLVRVSNSRKYKSDTDCDFIYLVTDIRDPYVKVVGIADNGKVTLTEYKDSSKLICGYYRPKWDILDNSVEYTVGYAPLGQFYESENTAEDATVREVGYLDSSNKPTIKMSSVKLSIINYTTLLSSVMDGLLVPSVYSGNIGTDVIVDGVQNSKARECIQFLLGKGLNAAAACGICGNIEAESVPPYNTASMGDYSNGVYHSFGICQWYRGRGQAMKQFVGDNWQNNLTGQLEYLWHELQTTYKQSVLLQIQGLPNTEQGARQVADIFVRNFEIPANIDYQSSIRQANASKLFNSLILQMTTTVDSKSSIVTSNTVFNGKTVDIPTWVPQSPINAIYTNYTYFYSQWGKSTLQYKVAQLWDSKGRKSNRNIATIDGLYLVALKTTFGYSGDKVSIVLDNGAVVNCIIADSKGNENAGVSYAAYGHTTAGGKANIVEFEAIGNTNSVYIPQPMDLTGWEGHTVSKIINGGSVL